MYKHLICLTEQFTIKCVSFLFLFVPLVFPIFLSLPLSSLRTHIQGMLDTRRHLNHLLLKRYLQFLESREIKEVQIISLF